MNHDDKLRSLIYIINKLNKAQNRSGETAIQKLLYLMIIKNKLPFGYDYILYDYGPWSFDLANDIKFLENAHLINKIPDPSGMGFKITPNESMPFVKETNQHVRDDTPYAAKIDEIIKTYKDISAKSLALLTTFIFVCKKYPGKNKDEIIELVKRIKPLHNGSEYDHMYDECKQLINES